MNRTFLTVSLLILFSFISTQTSANTSVWKVSKGDDYFYIGGTIHVLNQSDYPLPSAFNKAYQKADTLIFETDIDAVNQPDQQNKMMASMMFNDERGLSSELSPAVYQALQSFLAERGMPISHFEKYQPWGLSIILTFMEYERLGMVSELGVDQHFNDKGKADNKQFASLESIDDQLGFLESLSEINADVIIRYTIEDIESFPQWISAMKNAWRTGNIEAFNSMPSVVEMRTRFPKVFKALIVDRNNKWMTKISKLTNNQSIEFILVGALHLNDTMGLLHQLKQAGFKVEQI